MGFFSLFGTFSAAMIFFSLIASLVIACGLIGVLNYRKVLAQRREQKMARSLAGAGADGEQTMVST